MRVGLARRAGLHVARTRHWSLVPRNYYSAVPDLEELTGQDWERRDSLLGIELDLDRQVRYLERELAEPLREISTLLGDTGLTGFDIENTSYGAVDAELLWAMIRRHRPSRVLELGAGNSTLVIAAALEANRRDGHAARHSVCDPHLPDTLPPRLAGAVEGVAGRAQDLPASAYEELGEGDVLFVDTTHAVKLGGDVTAIVLGGLPRLGPGVLVHFHDIWLPFEYHRVLYELFGWYWNEQYLLQAYLAFNARVEVLIATQALVRDHLLRLRALIPSYSDAYFPTSFWLRTLPASPRQ